MKTTGDLSKAPSWATHYVERRVSGTFWFVEPDGRWTACNSYLEFPKPSAAHVGKLLRDHEQYLVIELNFTLENE